MRRFHLVPSETTLLRFTAPGRIAAGALLLLLTSLHSLTVADGTTSRWKLFSPVSTLRVDTTPHPAVVRVFVDEGRAQANGTGSLVGAREQHGLVVTNWHVVRDAKGPIQVVFPDGFRSEATVLKTDKDWDLAALLVWRPTAVPLAIGSVAPQPGDSLTIAGYGQGDYRAVTGKCTQYVAPSMKHPYEILELSAEARQGDSGGPILNERGELAGVLFGASRGTTTGSYCGRVRWFLSSVWPELATTGTDQTAATSKPFVAFQPERAVATDGARSLDLVPIRTSERAVEPPPPPLPDLEADFSPEITYGTPSVLLPPLPVPSPKTAFNWDELLGKTNLDRAKSLLAAIGLLAVWGHLSRWMTR